MEINGHPYYVKSKEGVPYLYDVDTNDEVGYWSSKKGCYVMFSLYNRLMKQKYENNNNNEDEDDKKNNNEFTSSDDSNLDSNSESEPDESSSKSEAESETSESESTTTESLESESEETRDALDRTTKQMNTYSLIFLFLVFFVYLTLQKEFQSIYFDFIFLILINLLNTLKVFEMLNEE
jgi:hypothetical protein